MRLSSRVILCSVFAVIGHFSNLSAADFSFQAPQGGCVLISSSRTEKAFQRAALTRLNERLSNICSALPGTMDDIFSEASLQVWREAARAAIFGFWIDASSDAAEITIRGMDLMSFLSWGQAVASSVNITESSTTHLIYSLVDRVLDDYPYAGMVEGNTFFAWTKSGSLKVALGKRNGFERHPFLPFLLTSEFEALSQSGGVLSKEEDTRSWKLDFSRHTEVSTKRLWLKSVSSVTP